MGGPQLGELEAGFVASLFASAAVGVTVSVVSGGAATLILTALIAIRAPILRSYDVGTHVSPRFPVKEPTPGRAGTPIAG